MDFTREPIIETVITPREGYRLVVRSSKGAGFEEHFVEALEVVSFGSSVFFRCQERPKPFIVPVADYEVLEVREPRMVLKTPSEHVAKVQREKPKPEVQKIEAQPQVLEGQSAPTAAPQPQEARAERTDRRRDRRRGFRRRRGQGRDEGAPTQESSSIEDMAEERLEAGFDESETGLESKLPSTTPMLSSILPPPTTLIRDDLQRLREKEEYKGAFYIPSDKDDMGEDDDSSLSGIGTPSDDELHFREVPYDLTEEDIRMNEGGDQEVSQEEPFRPASDNQEAGSSTSQDLQKEVT